MARSIHLASRGSQESQAAPLTVVVRSSVEREVKLSIDDRFHLPHLAGAPLLRRLLTSTYYDTVSHDLAESGITLRRRIDHGVSKWQLKLPLIDDRLEVEVVDRRSSPPSALLDLLVLHLDGRPLVPVAVIRTRRTGIRVQGDQGPIADVTVDHAFVMNHGAVSQRFRELEIERINGEDTSLSDLERQLRRAGAGDHDGRPKLFRALSLPAMELDPPPAPDVPVIEHVTRALARHVRWLAAHDPGTRLGREPESLHQMRVATRQLRALLHTARPLLAADWVASFEDDLAWLSGVLGPARDLDVQLAYFRDEAGTLDARDRAPLLRFLEHLEARRGEVAQTLRHDLTSPRYLALISRLKTAPRHPAVVNSTLTLNELAKREFKKVRKTIRGAGASPNPEVVHRIRIKTKRARYAAELAKPAVGKPATRFIKQARALSDILGMHQDAFQAEAHVRAFLKHSSNVRAAFVAGRMVERQRARRKEARKAMTTLSRRLLKRGKQAWMDEHE